MLVMWQLMWTNYMAADVACTDDEDSERLLTFMH
jgi:hypothetical protein